MSYYLCLILGSTYIHMHIHTHTHISALENINWNMIVSLYLCNFFFHENMLYCPHSPLALRMLKLEGHSVHSQESWHTGLFCGRVQSQCSRRPWYHYSNLLICVNILDWHWFLFHAQCGGFSPGEYIGMYPFDTLRPEQNGRHFADDIFRCIFVNEKFCILIKISLKFVPKDPIDNNPALV